ncbi:hypothetical protein BP6252_11061 [Coleophoma cylindrospora]|uniref:Uncharacterized protein n=1 Tax=Coleophoma cylindrospora TaxID=1849047 RepID=A0A3D8QNV6_9HELO|nr:hypothetical protein BP6252_11061 [Coleophoma cylindrospora]
MYTKSTKTVLITGCSAGGIGDALAQAFHRHGHRVFATARNEAKMDHLKELGIVTVQLDVTDPTSLKKTVESVDAATEGKLDILVNNAGIIYSMPLLDSDVEETRKLFEVNVFAALNTVKVFCPLLISAKGSIINISSVAERVPVPYLGIYCMSKAALSMMSDTLRIELAPFDVTVINVVTGSVVSRGYDNQSLKLLPTGSYYSTAKGKIEAVMNDPLPQQQRASTEKFAESVVSNALKKNPTTRYWRGGGATMVWAVTTFLWYGIWGLFVSGIYGLNDVKRAWRTRAS